MEASAESGPGKWANRLRHDTVNPYRPGPPAPRSSTTGEYTQLAHAGGHSTYRDAVRTTPVSSAATTAAKNSDAGRNPARHRFTRDAGAQVEPRGNASTPYSSHRQLAASDRETGSTGSRFMPSASSPGNGSHSQSTGSRRPFGGGLTETCEVAPPQPRSVQMGVAPPAVGRKAAPRASHGANYIPTPRHGAVNHADPAMKAGALARKALSSLPSAEGERHAPAGAAGAPPTNRRETVATSASAVVAADSAIMGSSLSSEVLNTQPSMTVGSKVAFAASGAPPPLPMNQAFAAMASLQHPNKTSAVPLNAPFDGDFSSLPLPNIPIGELDISSVLRYLSASVGGDGLEGLPVPPPACDAYMGAAPWAIASEGDNVSGGLNTDALRNLLTSMMMGGDGEPQLSGNFPFDMQPYGGGGGTLATDRAVSSNSPGKSFPAPPPGAGIGAVTSPSTPPSRNCISAALFSQLTGEGGDVDGNAELASPPAQLSSPLFSSTVRSNGDMSVSMQATDGLAFTADPPRQATLRDLFSELTQPVGGSGDAIPSGPVAADSLTLSDSAQPAMRATAAVEPQPWAALSGSGSGSPWGAVASPLLPIGVDDSAVHPQNSYTQTSLLLAPLASSAAPGVAAGWGSVVGSAPPELSLPLTGSSGTPVLPPSSPGSAAAIATNMAGSGVGVAASHGTGRGSQPHTPAARPHRASLEAPTVTRHTIACVFRETPPSVLYRENATANRAKPTALCKSPSWPPTNELEVERLLRSRGASKLLRHLTIVSFSRQHVKGVQELFDSWARNGIPAPDMAFGAYYFYVKEKSDKLLCMKHNGRGATPGHGYGRCDFESRRPNSTCRYEHVCLFCRSKEHGWFEEGRCEGYQQLMQETEELGVTDEDVETLLNAMEKTSAWAH